MLRLRIGCPPEKPQPGPHAALLIFFMAAIVLAPVASQAYSGRVIDASTRAPLKDAIVTLGHVTVRTDHTGNFEIIGPGDTIGIRACGYKRESLLTSDFKAGYRDIALSPFQPRALYLSSFGIGSRKLREAALDVIGKAHLNSAVIDIKSDRGMVAYRSSVALAKVAGAQRIITIPDPKGLLDRLHRDHLYVIARIVVFKDNLLATARPELAVKRDNGATFKDREHSQWIDPFGKEAWNYNIAIAVEAAELGFDEIQFDYVRFPDARGLVFSMPNTMENRVGAVTGFLSQARQELAPYNVFVAADIFGYVIWNLDDTRIGQKLQELASVADYISPMLYPSSFRFGIPGYPAPVAHPYEIVSRSLQHTRERTGLAPVRFRPWLQAFRDYAFDRRKFGCAEIKAQITAAESFLSDGWMLWNPRNIYSDCSRPDR